MGTVPPTDRRDALHCLDAIEALVDDFHPWDGPAGGTVGGDPLRWPGYPDLLRRARADSGADEAVTTGTGTVTEAGPSARVALIASCFEFVGGSMGAAAGERVTRAYERAAAERLPVVVLARSGGARMQEGMLSLVQMARTADAARRHAAHGLLQVAYLASPTTGGVFASYASLADFLWAAPGALVGFAGPRVAALATGEDLPDGSHRAEVAAAHGLLDAVVEPDGARRLLAALLRAAGDPGPAATDARPGPGGAGPPDGPADPGASRARLATPVDAWAEVARARAPDRPSGRWWVESLVTDRVPLRGDRAGGVDHTVAAGIGRLLGRLGVAYVAMDRHTDGGRPSPAGFRTARRAIALGARSGLALVTFVDTPGADPSGPSENLGIAGEIARTLADVTSYPGPSASLVVGEGGSGGALALASAGRCFLLDGAIFSVISPEGAAAILERDPARAPDLAPLLGLTGPELRQLGIVDDVLPADADGVGLALLAALDASRAGDARTRLDSATRRWVHPSS